MKKRNILKVILFTALAGGLTACGGVKEQLGVGRYSPDEFAVVKRAPLSLPPEYRLRAPAEGEPVEMRSSSRARDSILGVGTTAAKTGNAEETFLRQVGTEVADDDIRAQIRRDNGFIALESDTVAKKLIFWKGGNLNDAAPEPVVDAKAETERLKKNREEGLLPNEGDVPVIERKQSTFDKLF